jgi:hypothetical protein
MGLDTRASRSPEGGLMEEDLRAFKEARIHLCGGLFSGSVGGFRGEVYYFLIDHVTGVGLYQLWIPPKTVHAMWQALEQCNQNRVSREFSDIYCKNPREIRQALGELRKFFRVCGQRGLGLINWW